MTFDEHLAIAEKSHREIWEVFHGPVISLGHKTMLLFAYTTLQHAHGL
jgi:hypothetical protein